MVGFFEKQDRKTPAQLPKRRFAISTLCLCWLLGSPLAAVTVTGTLAVDPDTLAGTDGQDRVLLYAPNPVEPGSSISHWDVSASPNLLMEPSSSNSLAFGALDLTRRQMFDIGWQGGSSNIEIRIQDADGQGFNDPSLGAQRRQAIEFAAGIWESALRSNVTINVEVSFSALDCGDGGGVLAQAGPQFIFESFPGAPVGGTWYHGALAEALSGQNLSLQDVSDPIAGELTLTFNSRIDQACLGAGTRYYYGLNGNGGSNTINFVMVALHEMGHGLGFSSLVNESTGSQFLNRPDIFSRNIRDTTAGLQWHQMNNNQRRISAVNSGNVVWSGNGVTAQAPNFLDPAPSLVINQPNSIAGRMQIATAEFGPRISTPGITGEIVPAIDGSAAPSRACNTIVNGSEIAGKIALIDRGECTFVVKVRNVQNAGARAVIVANNQAGSPVPMGGDDIGISIPSAMISLSDGQRIRAALAEPPPFDPGTFRLTESAISRREGIGSISIGIERFSGTDGDVSVDYTTTDGTATAGSDYTQTSGTVTFLDGEDGTQNITIPILDDGASEDEESFFFALSNPEGDANLGNPRSAEITITDNEPCEPSDTIICLQNGRFRVRVDWRNAQNERGDGSLVTGGTDDSALFWFFDPDNWEFLVKVLDACFIADRYWVFAAATTDVEYTLRVTDTETGVTRFYENPLGVSSDAITDTNAFASCP